MQINYSTQSKGWRDAVEKFGTIFQLPIIRSSYGYIRENYNNQTILDVGAGVDLYIKKMLKLNENTYFSLDNDLSGTFTYRHVSDIPNELQFDWIVLNQILEHLTIEQAYEMLLDLRSHLKQDGRTVITLPNTFHPIRYWSDPTHVTPWSYAAMYALCRVTGYKVHKIYRYSKNRRPLDPLSRVIERIMRRLYRIDWCDSIMIIATK